MAAYRVNGEIIKSSVIGKIRQAFAVTAGEPPVTIYPIITKELTLQGHDKPSFFVTQIDTSQEEVQRDVYERMYQMNVRYFPEASTTTNEILDEIGNQLMEALRYIDVPMIVSKTPENEFVLETRKVRGESMDYKIQEEILQMFVNYTIRVKPPKETHPVMLDLAITESIKE